MAIPQMIRTWTLNLLGWELRVTDPRDWLLFVKRMFTNGWRPWYTFVRPWPHWDYEAHRDTFVRGFWCAPFISGCKPSTRHDSRQHGL